jgi:hypothetical protein
MWTHNFKLVLLRLLLIKRPAPNQDLITNGKNIDSANLLIFSVTVALKQSIHLLMKLDLSIIMKSTNLTNCNIVL